MKIEIYTTKELVAFLYHLAHFGWDECASIEQVIKPNGTHETYILELK